MSTERDHVPFKRLGERLKTIREKLHESVVEVAGAVEIDETVLDQIEKGNKRPSEDILMLLISHFNMREDEATVLWRLAGYEPPRDTDTGRDHDDSLSGRAAVLIMAVDPRVMYSDSVQAAVNQSGVVLNFAQGAGTPSAITIARIGMSREQAQNVIGVLQNALQRTEPRRLSGGEGATGSNSGSANPNTTGEQKA